MNVCNLSQPHSQNVNETAKRKWFVSIVNPTRVLTCSTSQSLSREALNFFMQASARCKWVEYCEWKCVKIIYQCIVLIQFSLIYTTYKLFNTTTKVNYNIRGTFLVLLFFVRFLSLLHSAVQLQLSIYSQKCPLIKYCPY